MTAKHSNSPRDAGYSKDQAKYYQDSEDSWLNKKSKSIFAGKFQKDLFIFAMAVGKYRGQKTPISPPKQNNVSADAMTERQKWAVLTIGISECNNLLCLKDELPLYANAEEYAYEGLNILVSRIEKYGINYPKTLETELKEILEEKS